MKLFRRQTCQQFAEVFSTSDDIAFVSDYAQHSKLVVLLFVDDVIKEILNVARRNPNVGLPGPDCGTIRIAFDRIFRRTVFATGTVPATCVMHASGVELKATAIVVHGVWPICVA